MPAYEAYTSPRWIKSVGQMTSCYPSLTFAFSDPGMPGA
jgi:hypothetical protein